MRSPESRAGSELKRVVDAAARRVDEIVDGAERVASQIIAEAEAEAERDADRRREEVERAVDAWSAELRAMAERLGQRGERLRELTEAMVAELADGAAVLGRVPPELERRPGAVAESSQGPSPASPAPAPRQAEGQREPEPGSGERDRPPGPAPEAESPRPGPHGRETALLRAAQMAVAGSSREEIERELSAELAIEDPAPIVDELLGPRR
jgi:hypothetical protein